MQFAIQQESLANATFISSCKDTMNTEQALGETSRVVLHVNWD